MPAYAVAGTALDVDLELPELGAPAAAPGPLAWTVRRADALVRDGLRTITELRTTNGNLWGTIEAGPDAYRLAFPGHAAFEVDTEGRRIGYVVEPGASDRDVRHLLIDQVLPYLLVLDGALVLHGSCVAVDGGAVGFIGPTGAGKSSMAAAFVQAGAALMADDLVVLEPHGEGYVVSPTYPSLRLWEDSAAHFSGAAPDGLPRVADYTDKRRWAVPWSTAPDGSAGAVPLRALVALGSRPEPGAPDCRIGRLRGADAYMVISEQGFRLERSGREHHEADLERYGRLVERVPVHLVEYRRAYDLLPTVRAAIVGALG